MKLGVIADDFTGASDIALTLAEGGMAATLYAGIPAGPAEAGVQAGIVALKSRTTPAAEAVTDSLAACDWLTTHGATQIVFKICSTFDSTPKGNIGPVTAALAERLGERQVLVCPAFPENGRSVYQGHLFVGDRLLNESGMQDHPLTPMRDADLRRVLAAQTDWAVAHLPAAAVWNGPDATAAALPAGPVMVIADALRDADLHTLGAAAADRKLLTGGSGIALGLPANFGARPARPEWRGIDGPGAILSGSCSNATRAQIDAYATRGPTREVTPDDIMEARVTGDGVAAWALDQPAPPLIHTSADPARVAEAQTRYGRDRIAEAIEDFFAALARALATRGVVRLVVAGGETSGAVVAALEATALQVGPRIAAGVPALKVADCPLALALKSGNFGGPDFFTEALQTMEPG